MLSRALIDFTLSNARQFYSSMGNILDGKGLNRCEKYLKNSDLSADSNPDLCHPHDVQLPVGLIAQLQVEHCPGITEVRV